MVLITIVTGAYKPTNITGGPHIVVNGHSFGYNPTSDILIFFAIGVNNDL